MGVGLASRFLSDHNLILTNSTFWDGEPFAVVVEYLLDSNILTFGAVAIPPEHPHFPYGYPVMPAS